jgi:histidinol phosphatase-like enzyme
MAIKFMHQYQLDLSQCIMVGDKIDDFNFSRRVGMQFKTEKEFFNR